MSTHGDGGKGSVRRKEDASKIRDNWDLIFGHKETLKMDNEYEDIDEDDFYDDDEEAMCNFCNGTGEGQYDGSSCSKCHGTGMMPKDGEDDDYY